MASTRTFRTPNSADEERQMLENAVPKSTRCVNKWAMKIYSEWQGARLNQKASNEQNNSAADTSNIQDLDVNLCSMSAEPNVAQCLWVVIVIQSVKRTRVVCSTIARLI